MTVCPVAECDHEFDDPSNQAALQEHLNGTHDAEWLAWAIVEHFPAINADRDGQPDPLPRRGDHVEQWLKAQRDAASDYPTQWEAADGLLDLYRLHADAGTPLDQHVCEGGNADDCAGCYDRAVRR